LADGKLFPFIYRKGKGKGVGKYIGGNKSVESSYLDGAAIFRRSPAMFFSFLID
jgi:hypothetical protein